MATSDILGLFVSPEQYQAQQMAQQQTADQARALGFAGLSPLQQANYGVFMGAQQLGRGFGGLLGVQDPQLQRIRQRQEIMQTINPADPNSLMAGIQRASQMGDQELALTLADYARKARGDLALAEQREREKVPEAIQIAEEIRKLTVKRDALPEGAERNSIDAQIKRLQLAQKATGSMDTEATKNAFQLTVAENPTLATDSEDFKTKLAANLQNLLKKGGDKSFESIVRAERIGTLTNELAELEAAGNKNTPEYRNKAAILKSLQGDKGDAKEVKEIVIADQIVALDKLIREAKDPNAPEVLDAKAKVDVLRSQLKSDKPNLTVVGEVKSGPDKGKAVILDETRDQQFVYDINKNGEQIRKPFVGDVDRVTSQVTATASSSGSLTEKTIVKGVAELDVEDLKTVRANKRAASASNASLRQLLSLSDQGLVSGSFASGRVGVGNLLNTLGVLSQADASNLSNSQQYQKIGADLIFNALQGKLGTGVSNADRDFIKEIFPQLETSADARRKLIKYLADKNNKLIEEADAVEAYIRKNPDKGLSGYKPKDSGAFHVPSNKIDLTTMSPQELKALEQKLLKEKKGGKQ